MEVIRRLNREQGITVLLVTHDQDIADYADRTVTFRDGQIVSDTRTAPSAPHSQAGVSVSPSQSAAAQGGDFWTFGTMAVTAAARALRRNKMRAALTMLGIFIGVAAVIAMVAVGDGASASVQAQIASLGTNLMVVLPGATTSNGVRAGFGSISTLTTADADAISKHAGAVAAVSYLDRQVSQVVYANQNWSTSINGVTPSYLTIRDWPVAAGRDFTQEEETGAAPVCLLGQTVASNLFPDGVRPGRRHGSREKLSAAGNRRAFDQGSIQFRSGPGRRGAVAVYHRRAQGAGNLASYRGGRLRDHGLHESGAQPVRRRPGHQLSEPHVSDEPYDHQSVRQPTEDIGRRQSDFRQGAQRRRRAARAARDYRRFCTTAIESSRVRTTTLRCAA